MTQLSINFETTSAAAKVADVVYKKSALTQNAFLILNYLGFFTYDAVGYPNYPDYEDFETFTNTLHCQGTLDYNQEQIANSAAYELLESVKDITESERKSQLENAEDWYHYYSLYCKSNNIEPIKYYKFEYGFEKRYINN